jgi:hypothetical protein
MINIQRNSTIPASLQRVEIQNYLNELAEYKEGNLTDLPKAPVSYRNNDVLKALEADFFSKCYLTEEKFGSAFAIDIDHFIPKNENPSLTYEWTNLFPAQHDANMARPRKMPKGGYLNPCEPSHDVEKSILYSVGAFGNQTRFKAINDDLKTKNTVELLNIIHNGRSVNPDSKEKAKHLKGKIKVKYDEIIRLIITWQDAKAKKDLQKEMNAETNLRLLLSRKASFTMLMRSSDVVQACIPPNFLD